MRRRARGALRRRGVRPAAGSRAALALAVLGAALLAVSIGLHEQRDPVAGGVTVLAAASAVSLAAWSLGDLRRMRRAYVAQPGQAGRARPVQAVVVAYETGLVRPGDV